jgi:3-methyladenine DNA glycosylase AlkC
MERKGARSIKEIPADVLTGLNSGKLATVNLTEWLAIDQQHLLINILADLQRKKYIAAVTEQVAQLKKQTVNTINETIGATLLAQALANKDNTLLTALANHPADMARCWAAYMVGSNAALSLDKKLTAIQPFVADAHFGVREISWLAVRPTIAGDIEKAIGLLTKLTANRDANIRRFASEATRPRGVWCSHIDALKQHPALGLPILEPLKNDAARYVQDSVGNWLNDAAKSQPQFVTGLCKRWQQESTTKETAYIIKKALRSL